MARLTLILLVLGLPLGAAVRGAPESSRKLPYRIVDTGQIRCYDDRTETTFPKAGAPFFGQDAHYAGHAPSYRDNGDGTVSDLNTGLMWQADPGEKRSFDDARAGARRCRTGGYEDWRLPTIKELYSLILFSGTDPDPLARDTSAQKPFLDTRYFRFEYGDPSRGERVIDMQYVSSTRYVSKTMGGAATVFGVNFADGRDQGLPGERSGRPSRQEALLRALRPRQSRLRQERLRRQRGRHGHGPRHRPHVDEGRQRRAPRGSRRGRQADLGRRRSDGRRTSGTPAARTGGSRTPRSSRASSTTGGRRTRHGPPPSIRSSTARRSRTKAGRPTGRTTGRARRTSGRPRPAPASTSPSAAPSASCRCEGCRA
jgi:hypothetical protein